jgi:hypothetical protein
VKSPSGDGSNAELKKDGLAILQEKSDQKLFTTRTHHALANNLMGKTRRLQAGEYIGHNGVPGRLIQGPQGVGKSTVLTAFAAQCPKLFPDVIPVYVSFDDLDNPQAHLRSKTVLQVVEDHLLAKGVPVARRNTDGPVDREALAKALEDAKKFVVLMVDEIDQAFRVTDEPLRGIVLSSLYELSWLGGQRTGRFVVYLCGSSSSGPLLITCQASKDEFPRQNGAPHLNGTKFQTFRLPISRFDDVDTVEQILVDVLGTKASSLDGCATKQLARLIGFSAGVLPRSIANAIASLEDKPDSVVMDRNHLQHMSGPQAAESLAMPLYEALLLEMRTKNRSFLDVISTDGGLDIEKVMSQDWQGRFQSLDIREIQRVWHCLCAEGTHSALADCTPQRLQSLLLELCDRNMLLFTTVEGGMPSGLCPMVAWQLFADAPADQWQKKLAATWTVLLQEKCVALAEKKLEEKKLQL